jgi:hypothetical protein
MVVTQEGNSRLEVRNDLANRFLKDRNILVAHVVYGNSTLSHFQCLQSMQQGVDKWYGIEGYHVVKCEYSQAVLGLYTGLSLVSQMQQ